MATVDGKLVPDGRIAGVPGWPKPWAFRCDDCGRVLPYGVTLGEHNRRDNLDEARESYPDRHVCGVCEGATQQLALAL